MAKIIYDIGFKADSKSLQTQLKIIQADIDKAFGSNSSMTKALSEGVHQAQILEAVLKQATTNKGLSFINMQAALKNSNTSAEQMVKTLSDAGMTKSLNTFLETFADADRNLISMNARLREMQRVMGQSIKFSLAQDVQRFVSGQVQGAIYWTQQLNAELNEISIVTQRMGSSLDEVYQIILDGSRELRVSAQEYAEASLIFYQQGLDVDAVKERTDITIQSAKAAGQSVAEMSQQLTAIWNTYQMEGDMLERSASIAAKLGAETAIAFADIATGMQISASAASQMGVSYESLAAIIATVGENTQQSASVIGTAYKTIFARFADLEASGQAGQTELGKIGQDLASLGVHVLDASGELYELDNIINTVGNSWSTFSEKQQIAVAQIVGGTRQYGQFLALMNDFDRYQANLLSAQGETSNESLMQQYLRSIESIDSAAENATESWQRAFGEIFNEDAQLTFYNILEDTAVITEDLIEGFGGVSGILHVIGAYMTRNIVPTFIKVKNLTSEMWSSRNLQTQLENFSKQTNKMLEENRTAAAELSTSAPQATATQSAQIEQQKLSYYYDEQKIQMTAEIGRQNIYLNKIKKDGDIISQNQAAAIQSSLDLERQRAFAALDSLKEQQKEIKNLIIIQEQYDSIAKKRLAEEIEKNAELGDLKADLIRIEQVEIDTEKEKNLESDKTLASLEQQKQERQAALEAAQQELNIAKEKAKQIKSGQGTTADFSDEEKALLALKERKLLNDQNLQTKLKESNIAKDEVKAAEATLETKQQTHATSVQTLEAAQKKKSTTEAELKVLKNAAASYKGQITTATKQLTAAQAAAKEKEKIYSAEKRINTELASQVKNEEARLRLAKEAAQMVSAAEAKAAIPELTEAQTNAAAQVTQEKEQLKIIEQKIAAEAKAKAVRDANIAASEKEVTKLKEQSKKVAEVNENYAKEKVLTEAIRDIMQEMAQIAAKDIELFSEGDIARAERLQDRLEQIAISAATLANSDDSALQFLGASLNDIIADVDETPAVRVDELTDAMARYNEQVKTKYASPLVSTSEIDDTVEATRRANNALEELQAGQNGVNNSARETEELIHSSRMGMINYAETIGNTVSGISMLIFSTQNLLDVLYQEDVSITEVLGSMTMLIPSLISASTNVLQMSKTFAEMTIQAKLNSGAMVLNEQATNKSRLATLLYGKTATAAQGAAAGLTATIVAATAAIAAVVVGVMIYQQEMERQKQELLDTAASTKELAAESQSLSDSLADLGATAAATHKEFSEGESTLEEYNTALRELISQVSELEEKYPNLQIEFSGNIDNFIENIEAGIADALETQSNQAQISMQNFEDAQGINNRMGALGNYFSPEESNILSEIMSGLGANVDYLSVEFEDIAAYYAQTISSLIDQGNTALASKFQQTFQNMQGFADYIESVDLYQDALADLAYREDRENFQGMSPEAQASFLAQGQQAQRDTAAAQSEQIALQAEYNRLYAEYLKMTYDYEEGSTITPASATYESDLNYLQGQMEIASLRIEANKELIASAEEYNDFMQSALSDDSAAGAAANIAARSIAQLEQTLNKSLYDTETWATYMEDAILKGQQGLWDYIGVVDEAMYEAAKLRGGLGALQTQFALFDTEGTFEEQEVNLDTINNIITDLGENSGLEQLGEDFLYLSAATQQAIIDEMNLVAAIEEVSAARAEADAATEFQGQFDDRNIMLDQRAEQAARDYAAASLINPNAKLAYESTLAQIEAEREFIANERESLRIAAEENAAATAESLSRIRQLYYEEGLETIRSFSIDDFSGTFEEQTDAFIEFNSATTKINQQLESLGISADRYIRPLSRGFLELAESEQEAALAAELAQIAFSEMAIAEKELENLRNSLQYVSADTLEYQNILEEISGKEWEVSLKLDTAMDAQLAAIQASAESLTTSIHSIGDINNILDSVSLDAARQQMTLTAEQAQEVADIFPAMLASAQVNADGTMSLNAEVVNAFIKGKEQEVISNAEAMVAMIDQDIAVLEAAIQTGQEALRFEGNATEQRRKLKDAESDMTTALGNLQIKTSTAVTNEVGKDSVTMQESAIDVSETVDEVASAVAANMTEAAQTANDNMHAAMNSSINYVAQLADAAFGTATTVASIGTDSPVAYSGARSIGKGSGGVSSYSTQQTVSAWKDFEEQTANLITTSDSPFDDIAQALEDFNLRGAIMEDIESAEETIGSLRQLQSEILHHADADLNYYTPDTPRSTHDDADEDSGSGSGSEDEGREAELKFFDERLDKYRLLERAVDRLSAAQDRLNKVTYYGYPETDNLAQQAALLEKELELLERRTVIDQETMNDSKAELDSFLTQYNLTQEFNEQGDMLDTAIIEMQAKVKAAQDAFNSFIVDGVIPAAHEEAADKAEQFAEDMAEAYDELIELNDNYADAQQRQLDTAADIFDTEQALRQKQLEELTNYSKKVYDLQQDLIEQSNRYYEQYLRGARIINDADGSIYGGWDANNARLLERNFTNRTSQAINYQKSLDMLRITQDEVLKQHEVGAPWEDWEIAELDALVANYEDIITSLYDLNQQMFDELDAVFSEHTDNLDHLYDRFSNFRDELDSMETILELAGPAWNYNQESRKAFIDMKESALSISQSQLSSAKAMKEQAESNYATMQQEYTDYSNIDRSNYTSFQHEEYARELQLLEQAMKEMEGQVNEATNNFYEAWTLTMEDAQELFESTMDYILKNMSQSIASDFFGDIDFLQNQYDYAMEQNDRSLNEGEKLYDLFSLQREIEGFDTDNLAVQEQMEKLLGDINAAKEEGVDLTEYDMEVLEERFNLMKAQAEFEDARNAKTTMRLARDTSGNWNYIYSADDDDVADKAAEVEDTMNKIWQLSYERQEEIADLLVQNVVDFEDAIRQLDPNNPEYAAMVDALRDQMLERDKYYREQYDIAVQNSGNIHNDVILSEVSDLEYIAAIRELGAARLDTVIGQELADLLLSEQGHNNLKDTVTTATNDMKDNWQLWQENLEENAALAGEDLYELGDTFTETGDSIVDDAIRTQEIIEETSLVAEEAINAMIERTADWAAQWSSSTANIISDAMSAIDAINALKAAQFELSTNPESGELDITGYQEGVDYAQLLLDDWEKNKSFMSYDEWLAHPNTQRLLAERDNKLTEEEFQDYDEQGSTLLKQMITWANSKGVSLIPTSDGGTYLSAADAERLGIPGEPNKDGLVPVPSNFNQYYSGGLATKPQWATLAEHGKELVLNSVDTQNILDAVSVVREVVGYQLGKIASSAISGRADVSTSTTQLDQKVEILAEFPNVKDSSEIEEAFNNLINRAAQYVSK